MADAAAFEPYDLSDAYEAFLRAHAQGPPPLGDKLRRTPVATPAPRLQVAIGRVRAWREALDADLRAWFERNGHPVPDPLFPPDEDVSCVFGCGTAQRGPDGDIPLLLADIDELIEVARRAADPTVATRGTMDA